MELRRSLIATVSTLAMFWMVRRWGIVVLDGSRAPMLVTELTTVGDLRVVHTAYSVLYTIVLILLAFSAVNPKLIGLAASWIKLIGLWIPLVLMLDKYLPYLQLLGLGAPSALTINIHVILTLTFLYLLCKAVSASVGVGHAHAPTSWEARARRPIPSEEEL